MWLFSKPLHLTRRLFSEWNSASFHHQFPTLLERAAAACFVVQFPGKCSSFLWINNEKSFAYDEDFSSSCLLDEFSSLMCSCTDFKRDGKRAMKGKKGYWYYRQFIKMRYVCTHTHASTLQNESHDQATSELKKTDFSFYFRMSLKFLNWPF